jgi:nucleotidyltransferase/DNA polymerase involved in DNA repair
MFESRQRSYRVPAHPNGRGWDLQDTNRPHRGSQNALCIWLPTFELRLELVRSPELDSTSVALLSPGETTRRTIWQVSERASHSGVRPGQIVSQAVSLCPALTLLEPDPDHYDTAQDALLEALSGMSPIVEPAGRGRVFVGMDGLGRLYGSPHRQIERVIGSLFTVLPRPLVAATRVGWAPGKFGAWVAAAESGSGRPIIVAKSGLTEFLADRPVSSLPVEAIVIERLERLGIQTLGALAKLPPSALVGQFGGVGHDAHAWASGRRIDPVRPFHRPRPIRAFLDFPSPVGQVDILHSALKHLLERALARPERRGRSISGVRLAARLEGGGSWTIQVILREASADRDRIAYPIRSRISISPPPRAVEALSVEFFEFGAPSIQNDLFGRSESSGREEHGRPLTEGAVPQALREAVQELKLKIGYSPLYRVVEIDPWSRIPERRHALLNFDP